MHNPNLYPTGTKEYGFADWVDIDYFCVPSELDYIKDQLNAENIAFRKTEYANGIAFELQGDNQTDKHIRRTYNIFTIPGLSIEAMQITTDIMKFMVSSGRKRIISDKEDRYMFFKVIFSMLERLTI